MTASELKAYIAAQLVVPVNLVSKVINSLYAMVDFTTTQVSSIIPDWTNALTFNTDGSGDGIYCKHPDTTGKKRIFETKTDGNINHTPPTNPAITEDTYWKEVSSSASAAIPEWSAGIYGPGLIIVYHNHSVDGRGLYVLLEPVRPYNSANIETEITAGDWEPITAPGTGGGGPAIANVYANIAAMLADQVAQEENAYYWVTDATTDGTVTAGWAIYRKLAASTANLTDYVKVQEQESLDITAAANGSETVKGVFEESTDVETAAGTAVGGTGAKLAITPAKLLTWFASLKASVAELITGTDNTKYITPSALEGKGSVKLRSFANNATGSSTIDCQFQDTCHIVYTTTVTGAITIAFSNDSNLQILNVTIPITGANIGITVPSTVRMARSVEVVSGDGWYESTKVLQVSSVGTADTHELSFKRKSSGPTFELVYSGPSRA